MRRFAIRVVGDEVKERHPPHLALMLLPQTKIIGVLLAVVDIELYRANTVRTIANYRGGNKLPTQRLAEEKGGMLAFVERAIREVPQRCLTPSGFINPKHGYLLAYIQQRQKGVVRAPGNETTLEDVATPQDLTEIRRRMGLQGGLEKRSRTRKSFFCHGCDPYCTVASASA